MKTTIEFTRVNNDTNGNPCYVCHFLNVLRNVSGIDGLSINDRYNLALRMSKRIGGRKFHNKQYGGGIVFQSYNVANTEQDILNLSK